MFADAFFNGDQETRRQSLSSDVARDLVDSMKLTRKSLIRGANAAARLYGKS
jgi:hypothetical protein